MRPAAGAPDVRIGGRGYVRVQVDGSEMLVPADTELSAEEAENHYRRSSEVMARQVERGKAPWMRPREPGHALPENVDRGSPYRAHNAVWLTSAADYRGYADGRWGTRGDIRRAGGRVRPGEKGITVVTWHRHADTGQRRAFASTVFNAGQCDGLPPPARGRSAWRAAAPSAREILDLAAVDHDSRHRPRYDPERDVIELPPEDRFEDPAAYLRAGIRQIGRWTGHSKRLDRETAGAPARDAASPAAAREELRTEIHALLAGCRLGVGHEAARDPAREAGWARALRDDPREIYLAADSAERMLEYAAQRARPRLRAPPPPPRNAGFTRLGELAGQVLHDNPPWDRSR